MKRIDRTNYEGWLLDRLEGRLTAEEARTLDAFLIANPDLVPDADALPAIAPDLMAYEEKQALKRTLPPQGMPSAQVLDDFLVARLEGELTREQDAALDGLLEKDRAAAHAWSLMQRTRVQAVSIEFPDKSRLKRREGRVIALLSASTPAWHRFAIAASIALLLGLSWWALRQRGGEAPRVADKEHGGGPGQHPSPLAPEEDLQKSAPLAEIKDQGTPTPSPLATEQEIIHSSSTAPSLIARERAPDRIDPLLMRRPEMNHAPASVPVPEVAVSNDPPSEFAEAAGKGTSTDAMSVGELFASTMRTQVLDEPDGPAHALDGNDAVALLDKGLGAISGDQAGLTYKRGEQRRHFRLRLGDNLALAASTSR